MDQYKRSNVHAFHGKTVMCAHMTLKSRAHVTCTASRYAPEQLIDSAIELHVVIYRPLTSDIKRSKIQTTKALSGERKPIKKPDIENLVKGIMDGCTGVLWVDDSLVTKLVAEKVFGEEERAEITIKY